MTFTAAARDDASDSHHEMDKYLSYSYPVDNRDILQFWKDHDKLEKLPVTSSRARHVSVVPVTSTSS